MEGSDQVEVKEPAADKTVGSPEDVKVTVDDSTGKGERTDDSQVIDNKEREGEKTDLSVKKTDQLDQEDDEKKDVEKPLLDENDTVVIDLGKGDEKLPGEDTPTLPLPDKKKPFPKDDEKEDEEESPSMFLHPIDTLRHAWKNSKSLPEFFMRAICIIFGSLGWLFCIGGVPLLPLVMLIMGSMFIHDCRAQRMIPVYLVVAGLFGLIQHATAVVTKYMPKGKRGILESQWRRCICLESFVQTFLFVWFIAGCVWVYSIYEPEYDDPHGSRYCNKTVYLFTFWMFNLSFIILCGIIVFALCAIICVVTAVKAEIEAP